MNESTKWLYEKLSSHGYNVGASAEIFDSLMVNNPESRKWAYNTAQKHGYNVGEYDMFERLVGAMTDGVETTESGSVVVDKAPKQRRITLADTLNASVPGMATSSYAEEVKEEQEKNMLTQEEKDQRAAMRQRLQEDGTIDRMKEAKKEARREKLRAFGSMLGSTPQVTSFGVSTNVFDSTDEQLADVGQALDAGTEYRQNKLLQEKLDVALDMARAGENQDGLRGVENFGLGLWDSATRLSTWDFGASDIVNNLTLQQIVEKWENDPSSLTATEQKVLEGIGMATAVQELYSDQVGVGYNVGQSLPESAGFMASMALNPASGLGKSLARNAVRTYGRNSIAKNLARIGGDIAETAIMTATTGAGRVAADALERINGSSTYEIGENGVIMYGGQKDQETVGNAVIKAIGANFIENYSEALGEYFDPLLGMSRKVAAGGLRKMNLNKWADALSDVQPSQMTASIRALREKTKFGGIFGEIMEEEIGMALNTLFVGDNKWSDFTDLETQLTTVLSCAIMSGTLNGVEQVSSVAARRKMEKNAKNAEQEAMYRFGSRNFDPLREAIDQASPESMVDVLRDVYMSQEYTVGQKRALAEYAAARLQLQYYNASDAKARRQVNKTQQELLDAQEAGLNAQLPQFYSIARAAQNAEDDLIDYDGDYNLVDIIRSSMNRPEEMERILGDLPPREAQLVSNYIYSRARMDGAYQGRSNRAEDYVDDFAYALEPAVVTDAEGNRTITTALLGDRSVYVLDNNGDLAHIMRPDGSKTLVKASELTNITTSSAEEVIDRYRDMYMSEYYAETENAFEHHPKTQAPQVGLQLQSPEGEVVITAVNDNMVEIVPAVYKDGQVQPKEGAEPRTITIDDAYAWQDDYYLSMDADQAYANAMAEASNVLAETTENEGTPSEQIEQSVSEEVTDGQNVEIQPTEEVAESVAPAAPQTARERVPKDKKGNPIYEQTDADTAWDAIVEETEGDVEMAQRVAADMLEDKKAALAKLQKGKPKKGATVAEKIANEKAHADAIAQAQKDIAQWEAIVGTEARRREAAMSEADRYASEMEQKSINEGLAALGEPQSLEEYVLGQLAGGSYKLRWSDKENGTKGFGSHTGLSTEEMMARLSMIDNKNGLTPEEIAHSIVENMDASFGEVDVMDITNMVIDAVSTHASRRAMLNGMVESRAELLRQQEIAEQEAKDAWYMEQYHATEEELAAYSEYLAEITEEIIADDANYEERFNTFAELIADEYENQGTDADIRSSADQGEGLASDREGSSSVGEGEETDRQGAVLGDAARFAEAEDGRAGGSVSAQSDDRAARIAGYRSLSDAIAAEGAGNLTDEEIDDIIGREHEDDERLERKGPVYTEERLDNGDVRITGTRSNGEVVSVSIERDGNVISVDIYEDGALFERTDYDANGNATKVTRYKDGEVVSEQEYKDGKRKVTANYFEMAEEAQKKRKAKEKSTLNTKYYGQGDSSILEGRNQEGGTEQYGSLNTSDRGEQGTVLESTDSSGRRGGRGSESEARGSEGMVAASSDNRRVAVDNIPLRNLKNHIRRLQGAIYAIDNTEKVQGINEELSTKREDYKKELSYAKEVLAKKEGNKWGVEDMQPVSLETAEAMFNEWNDDADVKALFDRVFDVFKKFGIDIKFDDAYKHDNKKAFFDAAGNHIVLPMHMTYEEYVPQQEKATILLHEMIHGVTQYVLHAVEMTPESRREKGIDISKGMLEAADQLHSIYNYISVGGVYKDVNGMQSVHEMVSQLADPNFRAFLKEQSLWDKIVEAIQKLLGIPVENNALDTSAKLLDYILDNYDIEAYNKLAGRINRAYYSQSSDDNLRFRDGDNAELKEKYTDEQIFDAAKQKFGVTDDIREAGYILPDGSMLDFSGRYAVDGDASHLKGGRHMDHREVNQIAYYANDNETGLETNMTDFIERGAIRIHYSNSGVGVINLNIVPTKEQKARLRQLISAHNGNMDVDFGNGWNTEHHAEYDNAKPTRILGDIDRYYSEGVRPEGNILYRDGAPFFSNAERAVENIKQQKATPEQWLAMIKKDGGLKAGEDKWMGLSDWLTEQKEKGVKTLTKDEVLAFIRENQIEIEEVNYEEGVEDARYDAEEAIRENLQELFDMKVDEVRDENPEQIYMSDIYEEAFERVCAAVGYNKDDAPFVYTNATITLRWYPDVTTDELLTLSRRLGFSYENSLSIPNAEQINSTRLDYTTEGLDNKREIALVVPTIEPWNQSDTIHFGDAGEGRAVAWVRFGETTDEDGNRVLVIDEVQSKRHDEGRAKGYQSKEKGDLLAERDRLYDKMYSNGLTEEEFNRRNEINARLEELGEGRIPDAPFDKNYHELVMKRMLRYAAENGFDKVAWTKGKQQAQRYGLSTKVSEIAVRANNKGTYNVVIEDMNGSELMDYRGSGKEMTSEELSALVGKELSSKLIEGARRNQGLEWSGKGYNPEFYTIRGVDLSIGGEDRNALYDEMIPRFMNKYTKKWGTKVGEVTLPNVEEAGRTMWSVDVTDSMRDSVMQGQPMFREGMGAVSDREVSYENDPIAKFQGKPRYYGKKAAAFAERERRRMENAAKEAAEMLGIEAEIITDASTLQGRKAKAKGWYDIINKKVVVVVPNHVSMGDAVRTVLHEGVAHHGLRELFGDGFDAMLDNVYNNVSPELKARIDAIAERTGVSTSVATEEYLAGLAETTNFEEAQRRGWWQKIKSYFVDMLRKLSIPGLKLKEEITDNELRYLLWRSYKNLVEPNSYLRPLGYAEDVVKQKELKVGQYAEAQKEAPIAAETSEAEEWAAITMQRIEELEAQAAQLENEIAEMEAKRDADDASRYEMWEQQLDPLRKQMEDVYAELEGLYSLEAEAEEMSMASEDDIRYRLVDDPAEIERLESEPTIKAYRAMQVINGELYPPMSAVVDGKLREPIALGQWERSEERPDLADDNGRFKLDKGNKKSLKAAYNPYFHSSSTPLNDQFSEAQDRDNLVTVEVEVPVSEADGTSGYKAEKAKDAVGTHQWKAGIIQGQLTGTREVFLTRWDKPIRIVPESEVADVIVEMFDGKDIVMPSNVVTPQLRKELEARGIAFVETDNQGKLVEGEHKGEHYSKVYGKKAKNGLRYREDSVSLRHISNQEASTIADMISDCFYDDVTQADRIAMVEYLQQSEDGREVIDRLYEHRGSGWARQAVNATMVRIALHDLINGREPSVQSMLTRGAEHKVVSYIRRMGAEGVWRYLEEKDFLSEAAKPLTNVNGSFLSCNPSAECAKYCYATKGHYTYAGSTVKSELVYWAVDADPNRAADRIYREYQALRESAQSKALRLFDKGDLDEAWLPVIEELNRRGIVTQIFSKRSEVLQRVDDTQNVVMLSIDHSNADMLEQYPTMPIAFVYRGRQDMELLEQCKERFLQHGGVILPVKVGQKVLSKEELEALPSWTRPYQCPIDNGTKQIVNKENPERSWNCTKCDRNGGVGCFFKRTAKQLKDNRNESKRDGLVSRTDRDGERASARNEEGGIGRTSALHDTNGGLGDSEIRGGILQTLRDGGIPDAYITPELVEALAGRIRGWNENGTRGRNIGGAESVDAQSPSGFGREGGKRDRPKRTSRIDRNSEEIIAEVECESAALGVSVRIARSVDELPDAETRKRAVDGQLKGYFDTRTGEVVLYEPNTDNANDAKRTILHEVVGHKGLRKLIGEQQYDKAMLQLMYMLPADVRDAVLRRAERHGWNAAIAMDEYLADQAERDVQPTWWGKVNEKIRAILRNIGFNVKLTDADVTYLLWRSRKKLQGDSLNDMAVNAILKQAARKSAEAEAWNEQAFQDAEMRDFESNALPSIRHRMGADTNDYEKAVRTLGFKQAESWQDSMRSLLVFQQAIAKASGKDISDFENAYMYENRMSSANLMEMEQYRHMVYNPLLKEIHELEQMGASREDIINYLFAKSGLERNEVFARRDAKKHAEGDAAKEQQLYDKYRQKDYAGLTALTRGDAQISALVDDHSKKKTEYDRLEQNKKRGVAVSDADLKAAKKEMNDARKAMITVIEAEAQRMVDEFEAQHNTDNLWDKIRNCTHTTLNISHDAGVMSDEVYNELWNQFQYYIPLRGFAETTAEDVYLYLGGSDSPYNAPIKTAYGRTSLADDPIATIGNMAESAIVEANRNRLKQRFLYMVERHNTDLASISDVWLEYDDVNDEWHTLFAQIPDDATPSEAKRLQQEFEDRMKLLAEQNPGKYANASQQPNIPYRVVKKGDKQEHHVIVKRNGKDVVITINGNPRVAQAINGRTNPEQNQGMITRITSWINRNLSANFTMRNPAFMVSNFVRDGFYTNSMVWVKENPAYAKQYNKNWAICTAQIASLVKRYKRYEKGDTSALDMNNDMDRMFYEFMINGGETGYTVIKSVEDYKGLISGEMKKMEAGAMGTARRVADTIGNVVDTFGRWAEDTSRFAAYMTSRQLGRTITKSIWDAKEISVNFNKKGSGNRMMGKFEQGNRWNYVLSNMSQLGRNLYVFWNAGVQGFNNFKKAAKDSPAKFTAMAGTYFTLGVVIAAAFSGDDDEDDYYNLPEYVRRNNICFKIGKGKYATLPLPIEIRAIYGLGELAYSYLSGREGLTHGEAVTKTIQQMTQVMPIDMMADGGGAMALVPSAAKPVVEVAFNVDWTGKPIYKEKTPWNQNDPTWTLAFKSTSPELIEMSRLVNEWTNKNTADGLERPYNRGWADNRYLNNPAVWEHIAEGYLGGMATMFNQTKKTLMMPFNEDLREVRNVPIVSRFVKDAGKEGRSYAARNEYYDAKNIMDSWKNEMSKAKKEVLDESLTDEQRLKAAKLRSSLEQQYTEAAERWKVLDRQRKALEEAYKSDQSEENRQALDDVMMQMATLVEAYRD